jgi:hypothetical protein
MRRLLSNADRFIQQGHHRRKHHGRPVVHGTAIFGGVARHTVPQQPQFLDDLVKVVDMDVAEVGPLQIYGALQIHNVLKQLPMQPRKAVERTEVMMTPST